MNIATATNKRTHLVDGMAGKYSNVHKSEWSWAGWDFDVELLNTSTLEDLKIHTIEKLA